MQTSLAHFFIEDLPLLLADLFLKLGAQTFFDFLHKVLLSLFSPDGIDRVEVDKILMHIDPPTLHNLLMFVFDLLLNRLLQVTHKLLRHHLVLQMLL